jgi:hypothetical protein
MTEPLKRKAGRPRKPEPPTLPDLKEERQNKYEKLGPAMAAEKLFRKLSRKYDTIGIYGIDEYTKAMINVIWQDPSKVIIAADPVHSRLDNFNRGMAERSFSLYRWETYPTSGFIEEALCDVIVVSKDAADDLRSRPNPYDVIIIVMEDLKYD